MYIYTVNTTMEFPILVSTVANNPLRASRVPVYTNLIDHKSSHFKQFEDTF